MNRPASSLPILTLSVVIMAAVVVLHAGCGCSKAPEVKGSKFMSDGQRAIAKGRTRKAIVYFEKEIELNPDNPVPYLKLALIYEHLHKDAAKAKRYYEQYLEKETNETKRERVEGWHKQLEDNLPPLVTPTSTDAERSESADAALHEELEATRRALHAAGESNDEFAKRIIELEGVQDKYEGLLESFDELKGKHDQVKADYGKLATEFNELKAKQDELSKSVPEEITRLENEVAALEASNKDLEARNSDLAARNKDLEDERSRAGRRSLSKRLDEARKALKAAEKQNAEYARQVEDLQKTIAQLEAAAGTATSTARRTTTHVVQNGETLRTISLKYYRTKERWQDIYRANQNAIADPDDIKAGQELIIPLDDSP